MFSNTKKVVNYVNLKVIKYNQQILHHYKQ